jgi:hypothetical protein
MPTKKSIDNVTKLLNLLDKHIKEDNCQHSSKDLLRECEKSTASCNDSTDYDSSTNLYIASILMSRTVSNLIHKPLVEFKTNTL